TDHCFITLPFTGFIAPAPNGSGLGVPPRLSRRNGLRSHIIGDPPKNSNKDAERQFLLYFPSRSVFPAGSAVHTKDVDASSADLAVCCVADGPSAGGPTLLRISTGWPTASRRNGRQSVCATKRKRAPRTSGCPWKDPL